MSFTLESFHLGKEQETLQRYKRLAHLLGQNWCLCRTPAVAWHCRSSQTCQKGNWGARVTGPSHTLEGEFPSAHEGWGRATSSLSRQKNTLECQGQKWLQPVSVQGLWCGASYVSVPLVSPPLRMPVLSLLVWNIQFSIITFLKKYSFLYLYVCE